MIVTQPDRHLVAAIDAAMFCAASPAAYTAWRAWLAINNVEVPAPLPRANAPAAAPARLPNAAGLRPIRQSRRVPVAA